MLNIEKKLENGALFIALEGELDTLSSPDFEAVLEPLLAEADSITVDFEKFDYITISEIFDITGFSEILSVE